MPCMLFSRIEAALKYAADFSGYFGQRRRQALPQGTKGLFPLLLGCLCGLSVGLFYFFRCCFLGSCRLICGGLFCIRLFLGSRLHFHGKPVPGSLQTIVCPLSLRSQGLGGLIPFVAVRLRDRCLVGLAQACILTFQLLHLDIRHGHSPAKGSAQAIFHSLARAFCGLFSSGSSLGGNPFHGGLCGFLHILQRFPDAIPHGVHHAIDLLADIGATHH